MGVWGPTFCNLGPQTPSGHNFCTILILLYYLFISQRLWRPASLQPQWGSNFLFVDWGGGHAPRALHLGPPPCPGGPSGPSSGAENRKLFHCSIKFYEVSRFFALVCLRSQRPPGGPRRLREGPRNDLELESMTSRAGLTP